MDILLFTSRGKHTLLRGGTVRTDADSKHEIQTGVTAVQFECPKDCYMQPLHLTGFTIFLPRDITQTAMYARLWE